MAHYGISRNGRGSFRASAPSLPPPHLQPPPPYPHLQYPPHVVTTPSYAFSSKNLKSWSDRPQLQPASYSQHAQPYRSTSSGFAVSDLNMARNIMLRSTAPGDPYLLNYQLYDAAIYHLQNAQQLLSSFNRMAAQVQPAANQVQKGPDSSNITPAPPPRPLHNNHYRDSECNESKPAPMPNSVVCGPPAPSHSQHCNSTPSTIGRLDETSKNPTSHSDDYPYKAVDQVSSTSRRRAFRHHITGEDVRAVTVDSYDPSSCPCCKGQLKGCQRCKLTQMKIASGELPAPSPAAIDTPALIAGSPEQSPDRSSSEASIPTPPRCSSEIPWLESKHGALVAGTHQFNKDDAGWCDVPFATSEDLFPSRRPLRGRDSLASAETLTKSNIKPVKIPKTHMHTNNGKLDNTAQATGYITNMAQVDDMPQAKNPGPKTNTSGPFHVAPYAVSHDKGENLGPSEYSGPSEITTTFSKDGKPVKKPEHSEFSLGRPPCHNCSQVGHYSGSCRANGRSSEARSGRFLCWNCWTSSDHIYLHCPQQRLSWLQREELRIELDAPASEAYRDRIGRELSLFQSHEGSGHISVDSPIDDFPQFSPIYSPGTNAHVASVPKSPHRNSLSIVETRGAMQHTPEEQFTLDDDWVSGDSTSALVSFNCPIMELPNEILDQIFQYIPNTELDRYVSSSSSKHPHAILDGASVLSDIERQLSPARKTCKRWRIIAQRHVYRTVFISKMSSYLKFVETILNVDELRDFVRDVRIDLRQSVVPFNQRKLSVNNRRRKGPSVYHAAWRLYELIGACPKLQVLTANFYGAIKAFDFLNDHYPSLKRLRVQDDNDAGQCARNLWRNLQRCPELEEFTVIHTEKNRIQDFDKLGIWPSKQLWYMDYNYRSLKTLKLVRCPEVCDALLLLLLKRMSALRGLYLDECKLVTSSGLGRALNKIPNQLRYLEYVNWCDDRGITTSIESEAPSFHLCEAIQKCCSGSLKYLKMAPYRICSKLLNNSVWPRLQRIEIEQMDFRGCKARDTKRSLEESMSTVAMPNLRWPASIQLGTPHVSYR